MVIQDDRTPEQKKTHTWIVAMTDRFLSGWKADGGTSYAGWACKPDDRIKVLNWVESRSDAKRVREVVGEWRPRGKGHCHIYVVDDGHNALGGR